MIAGAFATTFFGNSRFSVRPATTSARRASLLTVRLIPIRPPTPLSVNPSPSWIGVANSVEITMTNENPPPGSFVSISPNALIEMLYASSSIAPL